MCGFRTGARQSLSAVVVSADIACPHINTQMRSTGAAGGLEHGMWNRRDVTEHLFSRASDDDLSRAQDVQIGGSGTSSSQGPVTKRDSAVRECETPASCVPG